MRYYTFLKCLSCSYIYTGRYICPGKKLGMMEIRTVATMILSNFEVHMDLSNKRPTQCIDDIQDGFTALAGNLYLVFKPLAHCRKLRKADGPE